jgi:hypothetical protein
LRARGVTIMFVSHATADVKAIGDRVLWLDKGRLVEIGDPDRVVSKYLAAMVQKGFQLSAPSARKEARAGRPRVVRAPEIVETIPNIDHRYGDRPREILGIAVLDELGEPLHLLEPASRIVVRISVRAHAEVSNPIVGFMLRNQLGIDFAGTNTAREGHELSNPAGRRYRHRGFPSGSAGALSRFVFFSPAVADGDLTAYQMCDWIDNALVAADEPFRSRSTATSTCPAAWK